ncbi:condensation domain-containing protein [Mucilaginibacter lappiensis]|uniref:NRPS condensation-like uncharacterized protein n=1 Tax=Mucilaginibacter lappiensis TaxID=354630 RepID=A0A841JBQ0_9SPHI|nr:condensation domain-containing protein [Mucilaginibacter lappiensis]MBB6126008.1 NRPS condensation-like uncharacterized protein [Mucilaginibacter lappiensis]
MRRKLLLIERVMHGDGNYVFNALLPVRVRGNFSETDIRLALVSLQKTHAMLNAVVQNDKNGEPWFVVNNERPVNIPIRIMERIDNNNWQTESVKEWSVPFKSYQEPLMRLVWIKGEPVSELLLVMHHCLFDGRSALVMLEEFLQFLDDPDARIAVEVPIADIGDIVPPTMLNNKIHQFMAKLLFGMASIALSLIPSKDKPVEKKRDFLIHWRLDQELSSALLACCKAENIKVNTIMCAILLDSFQQVLQKKALNKIMCPVDIRNFNPQIKKNNIFAFPLMILVTAFPGLDFFSNARAMQKDIEHKMAKLDPYKLIMLLEAAHGSLRKIVRFLRNQKANKDCMFSNLGKLDIQQHYKHFEVETIFSPSVMVPEGHATAFTTTTYGGEMDFSFISNEGSLTYEDAMAIKDKMMETISTLTGTTEKLSVA